MGMKYFKVKCVLEGGQEHTWAVSMSRSIRTAAQAVAFCTEVVGEADDRPVTRQHWRDSVTGEYNSIVKAEAVQQEPFEFTGNFGRHVNAIAEAPPEKEKE